VGEYGRPTGKSLLWGAIAGLTVVVALLVAIAYWGPGTDTGEAPDSVLVIALAEDADGAVVVAGAFVFESKPTTAQLTVVDTDSQVEIPGTTYDRLKDAYAFGGGDLVADSVSEISGSSSDAWVVLPPAVWREIVESAGGVGVHVPVATNAFVGGELYVISAGRQTLSGSELFALHSSSWYMQDEGMAAETREAFAQGIAEAVAEDWAVLVEAVEDDRADASGSASSLESFGTSSDTYD